MPIALLIAVVGSLALHGVALFGTDVELFGAEQESVTLLAEIQPMQAAPQAAPQPAVPKKAKPAAAHHGKTVGRKPAPVAAPAASVPAEAVPEVAAPEDAPATKPLEAPAPARPMLPGSGVVRFAIFKESLNLQVGRAEHRWEFAEDGSYRLHGVTETSGLAALIKPVRLEVESRGRLVAGGLQPETFRSLKNGQETRESADFDWSSREVRLARDNSVRPIAPGSQDLLSLNYQLAYLAKIEEGASIGVVTGKKYERYALDSLGEEEIEVPAGRFRTLHLRAMTDNTTEIWIALDRGRLPVKIRFTDKKGDSYEQVATELGIP
nr:DUF3108 domain-containing protein [Dechloromonas sp.]